MSKIDVIKEQIPPTGEIRQRLDDLFHERKFLRELLKLAEKRDAASGKESEARPCK
jgi:hypothetical protein